jgi:mannose-6-phosphate isomerase-like protein (cupin superfamily)
VVVEISNLDRLDQFTTLDGSKIRELAGPAWTAARNQSLAEATVPAGGSTIEHFHRESEEIYFFTAGRGRMRLADDERDVVVGDCVVITPGTPHKLWAGADADLVLLCACAPAYRDEDTEITEPAPAA